MQQGKTVAFSSKGDDQKPSNSLEPKSRESSLSRLSAKGTKHGGYNSMYSNGVGMKGSSQHWQQNQNQQLNQEDQQLHYFSQLKSSQGFFLNDNFTSPLNSFRKTSIQQKNQVHQVSHSSSQFFNSTGAADNTSNNDSIQLSHNQSRHMKLSQEKVLASFYKKQKDNSNNILLMPDRFWEQQDKDFTSFRQVWADHEKLNANLMHQYEQKRQEQRRIEEKIWKEKQSQLEETMSRSSSKQYAESAKTTARNSVRSQPIIRTPLNFFYYCSTPEVTENGKQLHGRNYFHEQHHQIIEQENRNKLDRIQKMQQLGRKKEKEKVITKRHSVHQLIQDTKSKYNLNQHEMSKSPLVSSRFEKMKEKNIDEENTISKQKEIELTSVQELELQLCQNRFTKEVYDAKIQALEQLAKEEAMVQIEENHQHAEKMNRKIKVYNKRSIAESIDSPNSQQAHFSSGGQRGMQKRAESMGNLNLNSDIDNAALLSLAIKEPERPKPTISYCWIEPDSDNWKPPPRVGCSINLIGSFGQQLKILLIGGMSSEMVKDVLLIDPETYTYITLKKFEEQRKLETDNYKDELQKKKNLKDRRQSKLLQTRSSALATDNTRKASASQDVDELFSKYMYGNGGFSQRYNHTAVEISKKTKLLIFGGEIQNFDNANSGRQKLRPHHRNCLNDLVSFDLETLEWRGHMGRGEAVEARRNHTANMVGNKHMVVIGGLNSEGRALDDLFILDIFTFRWVNICLFHNKYIHAFPQGIAFHSACFVSEDETSTNINIFGGNYFQSAHQPSKDNKKNQNQVSFSPTFIKEEGLYVFGGIDSYGNYIRNKMFVLKQNGNPPAWIELPTIGKSPDRRCMHTLSFMFSLSLCVVYGGMFESQNSTKYLDDLNILNLKSLEWIQVILEGPRKPSRAMHSTCVNHKSLIIFGGLNEIGFVKGNVEILELDQSIVSKMKRLQNFSLSQQQQLIHRRVSKLDETSANAGSQNDKEKQGDQQNQESVFQYTARMKEKVFLIDPEREREINKIHELERQQQDSTDKSKSKPKWIPPAPNTLNSSLSIKHNTNFSSTESQGTRTFLPIPNNKRES